MNASVSLFNPEAFLDATTTEVNERRTPLPTENPADEQGLYTAIIGEITIASGTIGKGDRTGQPWVSMIVPLKLQICPELQQSLSYDSTFTLPDRAFLDLTSAGQEDNAPGKSRQKKAYREACDLNNPGEAFAWRMLTGKAVKVKVGHEIYEGNVVERVLGIFKA